jgi:S1-C subfamily serine protease
MQLTDGLDAHAGGIAREIGEWHVLDVDDLDRIALRSGGHGRIDGALLGIGSLHVQQSTERGGARDVNMIVPIDLLPPILDELMTYGRPNRPPRPWLGLYAAEADDRILVAGLAPGGPAQKAGVEVGDRIESVGGDAVTDLASLWRMVWAKGDAGVTVPLELSREGRTVSARIVSADRAAFLKAPKLH